MNHILTDLSEHALAAAIKENLFEFCRAAAQLPNGELHEDDSFSQWYFGISHPWFNAVLAKRIGNEGDRLRVEAVIEYFRSKQIGTFVWFLAPGIVRADWESVLAPLGFGFSDDTPGLAVGLAALNEEFKTPSGFEMELVDNAHTLKTWVDTFVQGYGLPAEFYESVYSLMLNFGFDQTCRNYLGFLEGKPVATSSVFFGAGVPSIQMVATLPEARGKGIGAALTLQPLLDARKMGYRAGILQSSDMGFHVYKKLGFRHFCQIENFYLSLQ